MKRAKRPRIADVARAAGVSEATVSVVLNNRVGENVRVSEATQQKIHAAVRELGYVANPLAQSLASGHNHIIAVFTFEPIFPIDSRDFYYPFLIGIEQEAARQGYDLLLITGFYDTPDGPRRIYHNGFNRLNRADGAVLLGHGDKSEVFRLLEDGYPFAYVGKRDSPNDDISYVAADYTAASIEVVEYLFQHGHRQVAYIRSPRITEASQDREIGFRSAFHKHGLPCNADWIRIAAPDQLSHDMLTHYLADGITAFVAEDNELGHQLLELGVELNLHCPHDYSLAVLGDPLNPLIQTQDWTSFKIPRLEMGRQTLDLLIHMLTAPDAEKGLPLRRTLTCTFVPGSTVNTV